MELRDGRSSPSFTRSGSFRANRTSLVRRNQSMSAKQIRFYRNGDRFFGGLKLAVSPERYKEFESLLAELSEKLDLASGAVRCVFNAEDGSMITDISQLQHGVSYVCSSTTSYRQIENGYGKHQPQWILSKKHTSKSTTSLTSSTDGGSFFGVPSREGSTRDFIKPKLVTVIRNGKPPQRKVTMLLNSKTAISLDQVLDHLSAKGSVGKVDKLFTVDGKLIKDLKDLFDDDTVFIAFMAAEKFPEEGVELDPYNPQSLVIGYKVTPYRELKRPSNLKRTSSLRIQRKYKDENENMAAKAIKVARPKSIGPGSKLNGSVKATRPKSNGIKKQTNGDISKEELYPASVFERESSDSAVSDFETEGRFGRSGNKTEKLSVHSLYKIGRVIGDGNFAIVRECRHRKSSKKYALKVINKSKVKGKEHMIENEILILRRVRHECIVRLMEEFETAKEIFLVMELVSGGDLFDAIVEVTKFNERDSSHMVKDLARALQYLHTFNIVHRDIKPENLLFVNNPNGPPSLKLADFGLSIEVKSPLFLVCGTPTYVAPEILDESGYGLSVDLWALGVITYILLCGFPPFRSNDGIQQELFDKILIGEFEYLMPFWSNVSDLAKDFIDQVLIVDRKKRYTAKEVLLHPWIQDLGAVPTVEKHSHLKNVGGEMSRPKKLRAIALAIQTVIALLNLVRRRKDSVVLLPLQETFDSDNVRTESSISAFSSTSDECSSSSLGTNDAAQRFSQAKSMQSNHVYSSSRIPRLQRSTPCSHIAEIRKSISRRKENDCPSVHRSASRSHTHRKTTSLSNRKEMEFSDGDGAYHHADQYDVIGAAFNKFHHLEGVASDSDVKPRPASSVGSPRLRPRPVARRDGNRFSVPPGVLEGVHVTSKDDFDAMSKNPPRCRSAVPSSPAKSKLKSYGSMQSLTSPTRRVRYREPEPPRVRQGGTPLVITSTDSTSARQSKRPISSQQHQRRYSMPVMPAATSKQKNKARNNIVLTTKTKRIENITIHGGKKVDKKIDTKTQTTLSLEFADRKEKVPETILESEHDCSSKPAASLIHKVKKLAEEIETLASFESQSSADENPTSVAELTESEVEADSLDDADVEDCTTDSSQKEDTVTPSNEDCHQQVHYLSLPRSSHPYLKL